MKKDRQWMQEAIKEAEKAGLETWQNPRVGAVVVKNDQIISRGHTHQFGGVHAERDALGDLPVDQGKGATLYVTLEPCNHYGKQPPCTQLIIDRQISRVVVAQTDPHSIVAGKGIARLKEAGIQVTTGVLTKAARQLNPHYNFFFENGRPWIAIKQAISLDDKVAAGPGQRTTITNRQVYDRVHAERANYQGILIGSQTAIVDNPMLLTTVKSPYPPVRIVLDRRGRLGHYPDLHLLTNSEAPTWILTTNSGLADQLANSPAKVFLLANGTISEVLSTISKEGLQSLYVEGGPTIERAFAEAGKIDELITYLSPQLLGNGAVTGFQSPRPLAANHPQLEVLGDNVRICERKSK